MITQNFLNEIIEKYKHNTKTNLEEDGHHLICIMINEVDKGLIPHYTLWNIKNNLPHTKYFDGNQCFAFLIQRGFNVNSAIDYIDIAVKQTSTHKTFKQLVDGCEFPMEVVMELFKNKLNKSIKNEKIYS